MYVQCLGSGSVGSARFWLPESGSSKICGSRSKGQNINQCGSRIRIRIKINWILSTVYVTFLCVLTCFTITGFEVKCVRISAS